MLEKKIARVMDTFWSCLHKFKESDETHLELRRGAKEYEEVLSLLQLNEKEMGELLSTLRRSHYIETWRTFLWKEIYETLNKMQLREYFLVADLYLPNEQKSRECPTTS